MSRVNTHARGPEACACQGLRRPGQISMRDGKSLSATLGYSGRPPAFLVSASLVYLKGYPARGFEVFVHLRITCKIDNGWGLWDLQGNVCTFMQCTCNAKLYEYVEMQYKCKAMQMQPAAMQHNGIQCKALQRKKKDAR